MILQFSFLKNAPLKKAIIDSARGKVCGFLVGDCQSLVLIENIASFDPLTISSLQQAEEEIINLIQKPFHLVGLSVHTESGKYIGKVRDYSFDSISGLIMQIFVEKRVLFFAQRRIIPRSAIIVMTPKGVTVKDDHTFERYSVKAFFQPGGKKAGAEGVAC